MRHRWTEADIKYLVTNYPHVSTSEIAEHLGVTKLAVYQQVANRGIKKSDEFMKYNSVAIYKQNLIKGGMEFRFKKGQVPANKGKKAPDHIRQKTKSTWFKKGHLPHNTRHDGYISLRKEKDGITYAHIRVAQGNFKLLHRHIWEQHNGPIPKGMVLIFKNGDTSDFRIENLEPITMRENMLRNSRQNYPQEIQQAVIALNKLKKSIKNYGKQ
jgi:predicted DNA-binding protein YlxM (UPF0122 family)